MTTQEPVGEPGLDELWHAYDNAKAEERMFRWDPDHPDSTKRTARKAKEARTALITAIEAPWREALRRYVTYNETFGEEKLREEFGPPQFDGSSMYMEAWLDRVLRDPARALLHPEQTTEEPCAKCGGTGVRKMESYVDGVYKRSDWPCSCKQATEEAH